MPEEALETQDVQEMKEKLEESSEEGSERRANAWTGFVGTTANRQQYFDFRKRISQTNFQTAGVSVDALTSLIQSCGMGDSSGPWSAGSTNRRIVVFPLTGQEQHSLTLNDYGLGVEFHSGIFGICSL